ncbi:MAG: LEA type 2 family protein [Treponema sp.]|jgi:LEA14-like dessication related protein|nr:LEA type 2 family protein [Treponema sp.]
MHIASPCLPVRIIRTYLIFFTAFSLLTACKSAPPQSEPRQEFPAEPEFAITSIAILQADLINTRFKLSLAINNPNMFPITLSSFRYELYGDDNFWASGVLMNFALIPAQSSLETSFDFEMNFIDMKRKLLDDIIALRQVHYRVVGNAEVETGMASFPIFNMEFDYSGDAPVIK